MQVSTNYMSSLLIRIDSRIRANLGLGGTKFETKRLTADFLQ